MAGIVAKLDLTLDLSLLEATNVGQIELVQPLAKRRGRVLGTRREPVARQLLADCRPQASCFHGGSVADSSKHWQRPLGRSSSERPLVARTGCRAQPRTDP